MDDDIEIEIEESGQEFAAAPGMNCFLKFLKLQTPTLVCNKKNLLRFEDFFLFDKNVENNMTFKFEYSLICKIIEYSRVLNKRMLLDPEKSCRKTLLVLRNFPSNKNENLMRALQ